jgi:hypothetical protein
VRPWWSVVRSWNLQGLNAAHIIQSSENKKEFLGPRVWRIIVPALSRVDAISCASVNDWGSMA